MIRGKTSSIEKAEPENSWEATSITLTEVAALVKKLPGNSAVEIHFESHCFTVMERVKISI